jgi:hypothetical protein
MLSFFWHEPNRLIQFWTLLRPFCPGRFLSFVLFCVPSFWRANEAFNPPHCLSIFHYHFLGIEKCPSERWAWNNIVLPFIEHVFSLTPWTIPSTFSFVRWTVLSRKQYANGSTWKVSMK